MNQPVLQAEVGLPVVLLDGRRQQVPAQAEIERQIARDAEVVLHEEADEIDEHLGVGVDEVALHAVGKTEQEARPRLAGVRRAEVARVVAIEGEEPARLRLRVGQRRLDEADVAAELHRVLVEHPREVVRELHRLADTHRVGEAGRGGAQEPGDVEVGDAEGVRVAFDVAVGDTELVVLRDPEVRAELGEVVLVDAEPQLVEPLR